MSSPISDPHGQTLERIDLGTLEVGREVEGITCVVERNEGTTRTGAPYVDLRLGNRTGQPIRTRVWSDKLSLVEGAAVGVAVYLRALVKDGWKGGRPELELREVKVLPDHPVQREIDPVSHVPLEMLERRYAALVALLSPPARALLRAIMAHVGWETYRDAPAAKTGNHHGYRHGLLMHSLQVSELGMVAADMCDLRMEIDRDLLILGGLCHDLGKCEEYLMGPIRQSPKGRLSYHVVSGQVIIRLAVHQAREELSKAGVSEALVSALAHVVESHHGVKEYGSPTPPRMLEALLIHHADEMSAKSTQMDDAIRTGDQEEGGWVTGRQWPFKGQSLFCPGSLRRREAARPRASRFSRPHPGVHVLVSTRDIRTTDHSDMEAP